jgi:hypothetical protein
MHVRNGYAGRRDRPTNNFIKTVFLLSNMGMTLFMLICIRILSNIRTLWHSERNRARYDSFTILFYVIRNERGSPYVISTEHKICLCTYIF